MGSAEVSAHPRPTQRSGLTRPPSPLSGNTQPAVVSVVSGHRMSPALWAGAALFWEGLTRFLARRCSVMIQFQELSPHSSQSPICNPQVSVAPGGWGACVPGSGTHGPFPWAAPEVGLPPGARTDLASASRWQRGNLFTSKDLEDYIRSF